MLCEGIEVDDQLTNAIEMVRSYNSLVVVGAGVSANHFLLQRARSGQLPLRCS